MTLLWKYGRHADGCRAISPTATTAFPLPCTCGLDAAKGAVVSEGRDDSVVSDAEVEAGARVWFNSRHGSTFWGSTEWKDEMDYARLIARRILAAALKERTW